MTELKVIKNKPDETVVAMLEDLLHDANKGKLQEFTLVGRYESGQILTARAGDPNDVFSMFGKLMDMALSYREKKID